VARPGHGAHDARKECSRCSVRSDVLKVARPYVGPREGA
jgi:hypothetical protein